MYTLTDLLGLGPEPQAIIEKRAADAAESMAHWEENAKAQAAERLAAQEARDARPNLTVGTLRALIAELPDDLPIRLEGCDCTELAIDAYESEGELFMERR